VRLLVREEGRRTAANAGAAGAEEGRRTAANAGAAGAEEGRRTAANAGAAFGGAVVGGAD
jgi:hypothetical protein